jgi:putative ABC transport system permease protein
MMRPLPYERPDDLVLAAYAANEAAPATFLDWRAQSQSFEQTAAAGFWNANLTLTDMPERVQGFQVSPALFPMLGVSAAHGRTFLPEEEQVGRDDVVVISNGLWQRRFGSDPGIVGKTLSVNGRQYQVVGVMPPGFSFYAPADIWSPLAFTPEDARRRSFGNLIVAARLKPGVALERAQAEINNINARLQQQYPDSNVETRLVSLHSFLIGPVRPALLALIGAVLFVLLIACANVANLLLSRAVARQREMAVRAALGAGRGRIVRQLLTESALLGLAGGALGLLFAWWGVRFLMSGVPVGTVSTVLGDRGVNIDVRMLGFTLLVSLLTGLIFGLAPALHISKTDLNETLKEGGRGSSGASGGRRLRNVLVVAEVALSVVLLVGAGLMIRSFAGLLTVNPGFDQRGLLTANLSLPPAKYAADAQVTTFYDQFLERVHNVPGVQHVGLTSHVPLSGSNRVRSVEIDGRPVPPGQNGPTANYRVVSPDFFNALGVPLKGGRFFADQDSAGTAGVVIVNETLVRRYFGGGEALGKRLRRINPDGEPLPWLQIVGVVGDIRHSSLQMPPSPEFYVPYAQNPSRDLSVIVRSASDPTALAPSVTRAVFDLDKEQSLQNVRTMEQVMADSLALSRFSMYLLGIFSVIAVALAAVGIYSVISYSVTQRTHEIGICMALGAQSPYIMKLIVGQGMRLALVGIGIGLAASVGLMGLLGGLLYGVGATDPVTLGATALLLGLVALVACLLPARRATRVDPLTALRYE